MRSQKSLDDVLLQDVPLNNLQLMISSNTSEDMISPDFAVLHRETGWVPTGCFVQSPPFRMPHTIGWKGDLNPSLVITHSELTETQSIDHCRMSRLTPTNTGRQARIWGIVPKFL